MHKTIIQKAERYIHNDNLQGLRKLIKQGLNPNSKGSKGPLLHVAISEGKQAIADILLKSTPPKKLFKSKNLLHLAAEKGNLKLCQKLLEKGFEANEEDKGMWTPLFYACQSGNLKLVQLLISWGANITHYPVSDDLPLSKTTCLHLAILSQNAKLAEFCFNKGGVFLVNCEDRQNLTALDYACMLGNKQLVQLFTNQPGLTLFTRHGFSSRSSIFWGIQSGDLQILQLLIKAGLKKGARDLILKELEDYFDFACLLGHNHPIKRYILEKLGAKKLYKKDDFNALNPRNTILNPLDKSFLKKLNPLQRAIWLGNAEKAKQLIKKEPNLTRKPDPWGRYPIHLAAIKERKEILKTLIQSANNFLDQVDSNGMTPLHWAAWVGNLEITKFLIKHRADPTKVCGYVFSSTTSVPFLKKTENLDICDWATYWNHHSLLEHLLSQLQTPKKDRIWMVDGEVGDWKTFKILAKHLDPQAKENFFFDSIIPPIAIKKWLENYKKTQKVNTQKVQDILNKIT